MCSRIIVTPNDMGVRPAANPRCKFAKQNGGREAELKGALVHNISATIMGRRPIMKGALAPQNKMQHSEMKAGRRPNLLRSKIKGAQPRRGHFPQGNYRPRAGRPQRKAGCRPKINNENGRKKSRPQA